MPRIAAALVAAICWAGLAIQFAATFAGQHHLGATLWILLRYFTVLTNLAVALTMTAVAVGAKPAPRLLGGVTISILLVGVIYLTLLRGLLDLSGGALLADQLLHYAAPAATALWWLLFAPRARLRPTDAGWWCLYPLGYFAYALARGHRDHRYPYPFINVEKLGWPQTLINAGGIALGFILAGLLLVWIDSWRPLGSSGGKR